MRRSDQTARSIWCRSGRRKRFSLAAGDYTLAHGRVLVPESADVVATEFTGEDRSFVGRAMAVRFWPADHQAADVRSRWPAAR
jgi:hypothetical protein